MPQEIINGNTLVISGEDNIEKIEEEILLQQDQITEIISKDAIKIYVGVFLEFENLENINLPNLKKINTHILPKEIKSPKVIKIDDFIFFRCENLKLVIVNKNCNVEKLKTQHLKNCIITYPEYLKDIITKNEIKQEDIKSDPKIVYSIIPLKVSDIRENAFKDCKNLKKLKILENVKNIGENAFSGCDKLEEIVLPDKFVLERDKLGIPKACNVIPLSEKYIKVGAKEKAIEQLILAAEATDILKAKNDFYWKAIELCYELLEDKNIENYQHILETAVACADKLPQNIKTTDIAALYKLYSDFNTMPYNDTDEYLASLSCQYAKKAAEVILDVAKEKLPITTNDYSESDRELSQRCTEYVMGLEAKISTLEQTVILKFKEIDTEYEERQEPEIQVNNPIPMRPREVANNNLQTIDSLKDIVSKIDVIKIHQDKIDQLLSVVYEDLIQ